MSGHSRPPLTDDERALLTEEELREYDDPDYAEDGAEPGTGDDTDVSARHEEPPPASPGTAAADAGKGGDGEAEEDAAAAPDGTRAAGEPGEAGAAAAQPAPPKVETPPQAAAPAAPAPSPGLALPAWEKPEGADERMRAIEDELDALAARFDDGDITASEHRQQARELEREQRDLQKRIDRAEMAQEMAAADAERLRRAEEDRRNAWFDNTVPDFLKGHPEYSAADSETAFDFDAKVRFLQMQAVAAGGNQFDPQILQRAHDALTGKKAAPAPTPAPARELPPTLADLPAAAGTSAGDNEFAHLNSLAGEALEAAISRMGEAQRERYLAAG